MPRICDSRNEPYDYCNRCLPTEDEARRKYGNRGDGPDDRGNCFEYKADHPDYESDDYNCHKCGQFLESHDY